MTPLTAGQVDTVSQLSPQQVWQLKPKGTFNFEVRRLNAQGTMLLLRHIATRARARARTHTHVYIYIYIYIYCIYYITT